MRVVGGTFKGRKFVPPAKKWPTRPTTDISKEALFNILENRLDFAEVKFLDLFGGTGSHCYEMVSRGCLDCTYVDRFRPCAHFVRKICLEWGMEDQIQVVNFDVKKFVKSCEETFDYIFAGPPYPLPWLNSIPQLIFENDILKQDGLFVLEHNPNHNFQSDERYLETRKYGQTHFSFFK